MQILEPILATKLKVIIKLIFNTVLTVVNLAKIDSFSN